MDNIRFDVVLLAPVASFWYHNVNIADRRLEIGKVLYSGEVVQREEPFTDGLGK
jgi:hypothetical protein